MHQRLFLIILFFATCTQAIAQRTFVYSDPARAYQSGLELFNEKNFLSARQRFEEIYKATPRTSDDVHQVLMQNLEFYIAACAAEANDKDAEVLLLDYFKKYHETDKRRLVYFYLGKYYFQNKKYADASTWFAKVNTDDLDPSQVIEYKFDQGYSYFIKKKFDEAKPLFRDIKDEKGKYFYPSNYYYGFICFYQKNYNEALKSFQAIEDSKMYASVIPYYLAQIYFLNKEYEHTITYVKQNVERSDVMYQDEMYHLMGESYFQLSNYTDALPILESFVVRNVKVRKEDIYELGFSQYHMGLYDKAINNLVQLNLLNEKMGQNSTYALADCYLHTGQKDKARSAFQSASTMDFDNEVKQTSLFQYAKLSYELNYSSDAITALETYLKDNPTGRYVDESNEILASVLIKTKNYEKAYKIMESLKTMTPVMKEAYQRVTYYRAVEIYNDKKYTEAIDLCDKSLKLPVVQEFAALATYLRGEAYYMLNDFENALTNYQLFNRAMKPYMEEKLDVSEFRSEYNIGYCYFKKKEFRAAKIHFRNAIEKSTETKDKKGVQALMPDLTMRIGECYFITKDYSEALAAYEKVINNNWNGVEYALFQKAIVLGLMNRNSEKINTLNTLISQYPRSIYQDQATFEKGETYIDMDNSSAALTAYKEVLDRFPNSTLAPKAYLKTALALYNTNKKDDALDYYKAVIKKYPESSQAKRAIAAIKDLSIELGRPDEYAAYSSSEAERDSLTYQAAENAYTNNDCVRAVTLFQNYYSKYPTGIFVNEAHNYRAECLLKNKDYPDAFGDYQAIITNKYAKYYEHALLNASGIALYELKDTAKAYDLYQKLYDAASNTANTYTAILGVMKTAYKLEKYIEASTYADKVLNNSNSKEGDINEALYIKAKCALLQNQNDIAYINFNRLSLATVSERAAESKYMVAKLLYDKGEYKASLDTCFKLKNRFASYDYWVVKGFILIADDYYAMNNSFQAKATLESIIGNYKGDQALINEARTKLDKLQVDELKKSKIETTTPSDSLIMDQTDPTINK
jgi:tetratricopeptide (TPR) repeat protein